MKLAQKLRVASSYWGKKCELLKHPYKDLQHTETFVAGKLMQTGMFIYCFDTFLDNKTLYLLR